MTLMRTKMRNMRNMALVQRLIDGEQPWIGLGWQTRGVHTIVSISFRFFFFWFVVSFFHLICTSTFRDSFKLLVMGPNFYPSLLLMVVLYNLLLKSQFFQNLLTTRLPLNFFVKYQENHLLWGWGRLPETLGNFRGNQWAKLLRYFKKIPGCESRKDLEWNRRKLPAKTNPEWQTFRR